MMTYEMMVAAYNEYVTDCDFEGIDDVMEYEEFIESDELGDYIR